MISLTPEQGSSLVEALVAAVILSTGVAAMAQLLAVATATNQASRQSTVAMIVAAQKLEELRTLPLQLLQPSPPSSLQQNTAGYVDRFGIYTRRWSIEPISTDPDSAVIIQVLVIATSSESSTVASGARRFRGEARVVTGKARTAQ
jgi:Tfp pilus assembly protein PilV